MALTDNLNAYWKFDESSGNAADATGNANTFTNNNTATYAAGLVGNAITLAAASSQSLSASSSATLIITGDISISLWVYLNTLPTNAGQQQVLVNKEGSYRVTHYCNKAGDGSHFGFSIAINVTGSNTVAMYDQIEGTSTPYIPLHTWSMLTITYNHNSPGTTNFYLNGTNIRTNASAGPVTITSNSNALNAGLNSSTYTNGGYFTNIFTDAAIDMMGIWARVLSGTEVTQLYNSGAGFQYPFVAASPTHGSFLNMLV